ncbi:protein VACUOLELESS GAMETOPHYTES-like [Rutidosis leptorrhynchoides]|uniref:protein VACUOLELESS GAMETOPHYTES-like n=1 Tax=Rutidosis leptorrhynchoides TaxID=125765 RepID=UPI003A98D79C
MAEHQHFNHPHLLKFHKFGLEGASITCTGCKFPCTDDKPIYSCRGCKFYLHEQCFNATRSLIHSLHPAHPLSLFPSPTYQTGSFICSSCNKRGTGFCFCCTTCEFDLHVHCAYNKSKNNSSNSNSDNNNNFQQKTGTTSHPQDKIKIKAHPNHPLQYLPKPPTHADGLNTCNVCGTDCEANSPTYRCSICDYDAHVGCVSLPETEKRQDHPHELKLLHVNPYERYECDVCKGMILQNHCMYLCKSGCDYGMHVKCVSAKVTEKAPMNDMQFQVEMFKLQNQMKLHQMMIDTKTMGISGYHHNPYYRR